MWKYKCKFWLASTDSFRVFQFFLSCSPSPFLPVSFHPFLIWPWQILLEEKMPLWATATPCYTSLLFSSCSVCLAFVLSALLYPSIMDNFNPDIHPPRYFVWIPSINKVSGSHGMMTTLLHCLFNLLFFLHLPALFHSAFLNLEEERKMIGEEGVSSGERWSAVITEKQQGGVEGDYCAILSLVLSRC